MTKVLYLAEPIDFADALGRNQVEILVGHMAGRDWSVYRPYRAWQHGSTARPGPEVDLVNREALANASAVVAYLPERAVSVGVPREIEIAVSAGVPVAVLRPGHTRTSWALQDVPIFIDATHIAVWLDSLPEAPNWPITFHVGPDGTIPSRAHEGDAGYDLYASESVEVPLGEFRDIPTDVRVALPSGVWARITGRSSTLRRRGLLAVEGVIDTGYRGKLFAAVYNLTEKTVVEKGERVAQLIPQVNLGSLEVVQARTIREFQEIPAVDNRGSNGFGSTGS